MITHLGDAKSGNQDALIIMADGMGGHAAGNVASNMATSSFNKSFSGAYPTENIPEALKEAILTANDIIKSAVTETPALSGMGCTMVTAFVTGAELWWASVGDSHLYLLRDKKLIKHNADHSYGGYLKMMRDQGVEVEADPKLSPNMLMSAMIGDDISEIDCPTEPVKIFPGDRIIVASDGLDTLGQGAIIQHCEWSDSPKEAVDALLQAVTDANQPRQDNTTVIVLDVLPDEGEVEEEEFDEDLEATMEAESLTAEQIEQAASEMGLSQPAEQAEPAESAAPATPEYDYDEEEPAAGKGKMISIIIAVVVVLAAIGAFLAMSGGEKSTAPAPDAADGTEPSDMTSVEQTLDADGETLAEETATEIIVESTTAAVSSYAPGDTLYDKLKSGGQGPEMTVIPAGSFKMGAEPSSLKPDERPRHDVNIKKLAIGTYEITLKDFDTFTKATNRKQVNRGQSNRELNPVTGVTWDDAYNYTKWLSKETGQTYRLPSEAEWEYASRAGTSYKFWWGQKVGSENAHCFNCDSGLHPRKPAKVGFFRANPFGLYDTQGNVSEWVDDCYHANYKGAPDDGSTWVGGDCTRRVVRGGSFSSASSSLRNAARDKLPSTQGYDNVGFRVVREVK